MGQNSKIIVIPSEDGIQGKRKWQASNRLYIFWQVNEMTLFTLA
jgi:hypothetical protein